MAGPAVGISNDLLIVAGGANFASHDDPELWELSKKYHTDVWVMERADVEGKTGYRWITNVEGALSKRLAYASVVTTPLGVLVMGGEDETGPTSRSFLMQAKRVADDQVEFLENDLGVPDLPIACTAGGAAVVGDFVYVVAGLVEVNEENRAASRLVWRMNLKQLKRDVDKDVNAESERWEIVASLPNNSPRRMFPLVTAQHDGFGDRLYVIGGRRILTGRDPADLRNLQATKECHVFDPTKFDASKVDKEGNYSGQSPWKRIADSPVPLTAGTCVPYGPAHIIVPGAATLEILHQVVESGVAMQDFAHPGFPKQAYAYHTVTDRWVPFGATPQTHVTTPAVRWGDEILLVSGEIRPRVRTNQVWKISVRSNESAFGWLNMTVVVVYLLAMVGVGVYFTFRNRTTDDYFRGGKQIPWWAAGCSIFATMLSSITYMAVPAKAFYQNWVYAVGNLFILLVAPIAIYYALPFFRRIDATSAYEYLELRFNRTARLIGSGSFSLFHVFRMGVVLALAALALASVTPLTPAQCVIVMGVLSIIYCTLGGVEAVIWTDTIQTFVLLGGALLCLTFAIVGSEPGSFSAALEQGKFHLVDVDFGSTSFMTMAIWVVVLGGLGQNLASYTADQAVIQRYMTTSDEAMAARSIWLNGWMAIPAALIFFGMGTAFWMFYFSHPDKLDPTIAADRIMPMFISQELPIGLAGLVVAGIFAAAQSTVSTSMNSGATTIVTDFLRSSKRSERSQETEREDGRWLWVARIVTLLMGLLGMGTGLLFVDPSIKSLFDQFIGILGMFLGVLAGLFALGATTKRVSGVASLIGATVAILAMIGIVFAANDRSLLGVDLRSLFDTTGVPVYRINGYLYAFVGISICYLVGLLMSFVFPERRSKDELDGLTLWD